MVSSTTLAVRPPYRLDLTATALRRLSTNVVDVFGTDGRYRRVFSGTNGTALLTVEQVGPTELAVSCDGDVSIDAPALVRRMLGTEVDLAPFYAASAAIPWLGVLVQRMRGVKSPRYPTLWEAIVNAVVYQQVSIHAAGAILRRVIERYATPLAVGEERFFPFLDPHAIVDADPVELRALGLSINKVVALRGLARAVIDGELAESDLLPLPTPEVVERLIVHRGIGPWTAAVIALRGLGRLDIFPEKDSGVAISLRALSDEDEVDAGAILQTLGAQRGMLYYHLLLGRLSTRGEIDA